MHIRSGYVACCCVSFLAVEDYSVGRFLGHVLSVVGVLDQQSGKLNMWAHFLSRPEDYPSMSII